MTRNGRAEAELILTPEGRELLERCVRRCTPSRALALRSRTVPACEGGVANKDVPTHLDVHEVHVVCDNESTHT